MIKNKIDTIYNIHLSLIFFVFRILSALQGGALKLDIRHPKHIADLYIKNEIAVVLFLFSSFELCN